MSVNRHGVERHGVQMVPVFLLSLAYIAFVEGVLPMELNVKVVKRVKVTVSKNLNCFMFMKLVQLTAISLIFFLLPHNIIVVALVLLHPLHDLVFRLVVSLQAVRR